MKYKLKGEYAPFSFELNSLNDVNWRKIKDIVFKLIKVLLEII